MRSVWAALAALAGALILAFLASQPQPPQPASAAAATFSAERSMGDIREIARAPHPTGSSENARVGAYLLERMRQLGMAATTQVAPLPPKSAEKLAKWGDPNASAASVVNLIGVLPGRDPTKPALLLMAHYDSVWASPGAADDAAGVATALETIRALKDRGAPMRDVVVLFTDAEELGLNGAKLFFGSHPLARRIGGVINMETRGGGGRAAMFETGRGNGRWVELYRSSVERPFSNSLAVMVYELMPNNTDFTVPKDIGLPGFNLAFIGKAQLYHSPAATPEALDKGSVQDLGDQVLGVTQALAFAPELPAKAADAAFGDVLGVFVISYAPAAGWTILVAAAGLFGFAAWRTRSEEALRLRGIAAGLGAVLALLLHMALLLVVVNIISGSGAGSNYYDRLAALPRLEVQALLLCLATLLVGVVVARPATRLAVAAPALGLMFAGILLAGWSPVLVGLGLAAALSALILPKRPLGLWGGWLSLGLFLIVLALAAQIAAPQAAPLLQWPLLLGSIGAAFAAWHDPALDRRATLVLLASLAALGAGQTLYIAHFTFLGVGAPIPEAMTLYALICALLLWPLLKRAAARRPFELAALALVVAAAAGVAPSVRFDRMADTIPPYSLIK